MIECDFNLGNLWKDGAFKNAEELDTYERILKSIFDLFGYSQNPFGAFIKEDAHSLDDVPLQALANMHIGTDIYMECYIRIDDNQEYCFNGEWVEDEESLEEIPFEVIETEWFIDACRKMLNK